MCSKPRSIKSVSRFVKIVDLARGGCVTLGRLHLVLQFPWGLQTSLTKPQYDTYEVFNIFN